MEQQIASVLTKRVYGETKTRRTSLCRIGGKRALESRREVQIFLEAFSNRHAMEGTNFSEGVERVVKCVPVNENSRPERKPC